MNSIPPTPGRRLPDSRPAGSFKRTVGIVVMTVAMVIGGALLLCLTRYPWTKAKTNSAALLQKSTSDPERSVQARNEENPSRSGSRSDAEAAAARAKFNENPPGR